ncbi:MAG: hypothetical protein HY698_10255 [Deltaproteobacteria bacterium]|nr:hypothetical protein [Deltaproteobacteria bacterium]
MRASSITLVVSLLLAGGVARAHGGPGAPPEGVNAEPEGEAPAGPIIEIPPEAEAPLPSPSGGVQQPSPDPSAGGLRTSYFGTLGAKTEAIVNRTVIGGYGEVPFTKPFDGDSFFEARRLVFFFYSPMHDRIVFSTEVEFEFGGTPKKKDGILGEGEVILEFAVVDFKLVDLLNLRAGVVLVPFGKFNINHDSPTRDLTDRPLLIRTVIPSTWFEAGAGAFGLHRGGPWELNYELYAINGLDSRIVDGMGNRPARGSLIQDNNDDKAIVGRIGNGYFGRAFGTTLQGELGVSYYDGAYNRAGARARLLGGDLTLRFGKVELLGEVVRQWNEPGFDDDWSGSSRRRVPEDLWGFYAQLNVHFFPDALRRLLPGDLSDSTFTAVALYEKVDTDMSVKNENDVTRKVLGLNYRPIEAFVWKHEIAQSDSPVTNPSYAYVTSVAWLF